jgi:hypothetical protein
MIHASLFRQSARTRGGAHPARATPSAPPAATRVPASSSDLTPRCPVRPSRHPSPGRRRTATPSAMRRLAAAPPPPSLRYLNQPPEVRRGTASRWTPGTPRLKPPSRPVSDAARLFAPAAAQNQTPDPWTLTPCRLTRAWSSRTREASADR